MTALLFLVGAALLGAGLVRRAPGRVFGGAEQALGGLLAGWMVATLTAYAVARTLGRLEWWPLAALTAGLWAAALALWLPALWRVRARGLRGRAWRLKEHAGLLLVLALFAPVYWHLFSTHMLSEGAEGVYSSGSCWGDLGFHLAISSSFLYGQNFPPLYTAFPPEPLLYPFLPDFLTAVLVALGMSFRAALCTTGVLLSLATTGLVYTLARRINPIRAEDDGPRTSAAREAPAGAHAPTAEPRAADGAWRAQAAANGVWRAQAAAALAALLFLLNGGLGFLYFFADWRASGKGLSEFWWNLTTSYTNMGERHIQWTNLITDGLLPQRTSLFGVPAALMVFAMFAAAWEGWSREGVFVGGDGGRVGRWAGWRVLLAAGVLTGLLPLFHTHTYVAVGLVSGFLFLLRPRRAWLAFWAPAVLLALPHFVNLAGHVAAGGFLRLLPGWRGHNESNWPLYWLRNVGLPVLLVVPAWLSAARAWRRFYLAFVALKVVSLVVVFTPNDYDNIKLLYYWHAATCVLVAAWLVELATARRQRLLACLLALACAASGLLSLWHEGLHRALFFSREELAAAAFVREHTAPRSLFLAASTIHQPVFSLAGRPLVRGDTAWLWSHGYEFREREADVRRIYAGADDALELLRYYRVDYVYLGEKERRQLRARQDFFAQNFHAVYRSPAVAIYDTRTRATAHAAADGDKVTDGGDATGSGDALVGGNAAGTDDAAGGGDGAARFAPYPPREFASRLAKDPYQLVVEFPRAAFAVYRYYLVAYGRAPKYTEFVADMEAVGRGVYVGAPGWQEVLEENKRALTDEWAARPEFKALSDGKTDGQFVDALYANARLAPGGPGRDSLVAALERGAESRASALRRVADDPRLYRREFNAAYVLVHYFGYLKRNPGDPPDSNLDGYNFWLHMLDSTGDQRGLSLVFLESGEYRDQGKR